MEELATRSYWLGPDDYEPGPPLREDLDVDIAIVGGGFTGLWTAYHLLKEDPGLTIAVLEEAAVGCVASGAERRLRRDACAPQPAGAGWERGETAGSGRSTERRSRPCTPPNAFARKRAARPTSCPTGYWSSRTRRCRTNASYEVTRTRVRILYAP